MAGANLAFSIGRSYESEDGVEPLGGCSPRYFEDYLSCHVVGMMFSSVADVCR